MTDGFQVVVQPGGYQADDPNQQYPQQGGQYPQEQAPYPQPPQQGGQAGPPPQQGMPQQQGQQYPQQQGQQYPQQQGQQYSPQQQPQTQNQGQGQGGQGQQRQIYKLATRSGQAVAGTNYVVLEGYFNDANVTTMQDGTMRLGFNLVVEVPLFNPDRSQRVDEQGRPLVRNIRHRCQAWGQVAQEIAAFQLGTPLKIEGFLVKWNRNDNWFVDVRITKYYQL